MHHVCSVAGWRGGHRPYVDLQLQTRHEFFYVLQSYYTYGVQTTCLV